MRARHRLGFPVLHDAGNAWARQLGLVHGFPEDLREVYRNLGIDVPAYNGDDSWELPLATRLVVVPGGVIRGMEANPDYTRRPDVEATLELLRG